MEKTIIILTRVMPIEKPFVSYVYSHAKALKKEGYNVIVFAVASWFPIIRKKQMKNHKKFVEGITIYYFNRLGFSTIFDKSCLNLNAYSYYGKIKNTINNIIKTKNVVLIDAHYYKIEGYVSYLLKKKYNIKTFITIHGTSFNNSFVTEKGKKEIYKISKIVDLFVCVSPKLLKQLKSINVNNCEVIYNGIGNYVYKLNNDNYDIVTGTSLVPIKNIDLVIKAFSKISQLYKNSKLRIIGVGPEEDKLINLVNTLNISDRVIFEGNVSNKTVFEILSNSKIYVMPSKPEGFGLIYLEAMFNGCIPIGTKGEGIEGIIVDNYNGYLINPNINEIIEKIQYIFDNNCGIIKTNAMNTAKKYSWEQNAKHYIESAGIR